MTKFSYVDLKFKPSLDKHIIATYYMESADDDIESAASKNCCREFYWNMDRY